MLIRLILLLSALFMAAAVGAYLFSRDARYLKWAVQVAQSVLFLLLVFGVISAGALRPRRLARFQLTRPADHPFKR